jgi:hypothetical protein
LTVITFLYNKWTQDERMMRPYPIRMRQDSSGRTVTVTSMHP